MKERKILTWMGLAFALVAFACGFNPGSALARPVTGPGSVPDYFETPNWANSPPLTKFVDSLPGLGFANRNNLGQYVPVAVPDTTTYPGSDYYELELGQYTERMHTDMPATRLRGYRQTNTTDPTVSQFHYLGPLIIAQKDRPVRIKFTNALPTGTAGNLFVPVDTTIMGSGAFDINYDPVTKQPITPNRTGTFSQNRATLHLHGGRSPWISDGTPHQWVTPAGENTLYPKGVSVAYVPDMWFNAAGNTITACAGQLTCGVQGATNNPGAGAQTFYYTNQQSGRLMFYHDHAWGITRLNVYVGEAAGYLIQDPVEQALVNGGTVNGRTYAAGTIPADQIPLVIQDKTFVDPATITNTDPTWAWGTQPWNGTPGAPMTPVKGDLWWPHVYMPAQNPFNPDLSGVNAMGRWHYGPWFFPPTPLCGSEPDAVPPFCVTKATVPNPYFDPNCDPAGTGLIFCQPPEIPGTPNVSWGAEAFLDTMIVNGTAYPKLALQPQTYRLRILNAAHDRFLNLQLYVASPIVSSITVTNGGTGYTSAPVVTITDPAGAGRGATAVATIDPATGAVTAVTLDTVGSGYATPPTVTISGGGGTGATATAAVHTAPTEVGMVPAIKGFGLPDTWPADSREGGVPDPATSGPAFIQVGTEGGFLAAPTLIPNKPITWNMDVTTFNFGNVDSGTVILGPAERADVIVDLTNFAGKTLILYNDAPTAFPALDPHYDYYTGAPDRTDMGGYPTIPPGVGPNVRTVMQINVAGTGGTAPLNDFNPATLTTLQNAFRNDATTPGAFASAQEPIVVGQAAYGPTYNTTFPATFPNWGVSRISDGFLSFKTVDGQLVSKYPMKRKAMHDEMGATFDDYGRMSAKLGLEQPFANAAIQNFAVQNYVDPATELLAENEPQIWRITHNGVDTHPIHFHLFDVQVINRVGWDGFIRLPDPTELGWKDTVRISPLEDTIVALRPIRPVVPFPLPDSVRPLNPSTPLGSDMGFSQIDPLDGGPLATPQVNEIVNFGWEYVWHCHILSHEENDMMRSVIFRVPTAVPNAPTGLTVTPTVQRNTLAWTDNSFNVTVAPYNSTTGFLIERCNGNCGPNGNFTLLANMTYLTSASPSYVDTPVVSGAVFTYRITAFNGFGSAAPLISAPVAAATFLPASGVTLSPNVASPHTAPVTFTAQGTGTPASFQYRFWLGTTMVQDYSTLSSWTLPATTLPGTYTVFVDVRTNFTSPTPDASANVTYTVTATPPGVRTTLPAAVAYVTLADAFAFANANPGNTIQALGALFVEPAINVNSAGTVTFNGGFNSAFTAATGMTTLNGVLTVTNGTFIASNLTVF
jgi:FtsP/CotA-like multicopper oxidase with cupredoxin domain